MIIHVVSTNIEGECKFLVPLKSQTFIITWKSSFLSSFAVFGGKALNLLLLMLTFAGDNHLGLTWLIFFARIRRVARLKAWMTTARSSLLLTTGMWASSASIFAFPRTMA